MTPQPSRDDARRLLDMRRYALEAISFTEGKTRADLDTDTMLELALERAIEIVGEAAKNVSEAGKTLYPGIPWRAIARARDRFAHAYFAMDLDIVWSIATVSLPALLKELEGLGEADE